MLKFKEQLISDIGKNRYEHSLRVMEEAIKLAKRYNCDIKKAKIAGYLHDCAKLTDRDQLLKMSVNFDIIDNIVLKENTELIHGPLGSKIANCKYGITDEEVLNAIKYHTTGRVGMTILDKVIYLADYIEPMRNFPGVDKVRNLAYENLNMAVLQAFDQTIKFLIDKGELISRLTIDARNDLIINLDRVEI